MSLNNKRLATCFSDSMLRHLKAACLLGSAIAAADPYELAAKLNATERMAPSMAVATAFFDQMTQITGNAGGAIASLPNVNVNGGRQRSTCANLVLAAQASGTTFGVSRLPLFAVFLGITAVTDTSLGTTTIAFGDTNSSAIYGPATTLTTINAKAFFAPAATFGQPITSGFDCQTGSGTGYAVGGGAGGGLYEDITMLTAVAALPGAGNLRVVTDFMLD